ncbi:hypothetical protein ACFT8P_33580 [Streptomyces sp. NPDC057101]|uniref:hypothetical protein n=1 Tax=Streptomyces sp. NPDC057101 TaxID=3346020 RepID=UPI0036373CA8
MELADLLLARSARGHRHLRDRPGPPRQRPSIEDRPDLQLARRARDWVAVLRDLGAAAPTGPVLRAVPLKNGLRKHLADRERGTQMAESPLNERLQLLADRAGVPYTDGKKVTSRASEEQLSP